MLLALALPLAACGGGSDDNNAKGGSGGAPSGGSGGTALTGGGTGGGGASGGGTGGGSGGGVACSKGPGYASSDPAHHVNQLTGKILDIDGKPVVGTLAQVCGIDVCVNGTTNDQGDIVTCDTGTPPICGTGIKPNVDEKRPAFKYGEGIDYVKFAYLLPTDTSDYAIGTMTTVALPAKSTGVALTPGSDASAGGITVSVPAGATVKIDKLTFTTPEDQNFRAIEVPIAKAPSAVDATLGFEMLIATTPLETRICPNAKLSVPNTPGWPAGTAVEFWLNGLDPAEEWSAYAGWAKISAGTVSADGQSVVTDDAEGIPILGLFGIKKK